MVELLLSHLLVVNHNGIVEITPFNEVSIKERFDFTHKDESTTTADFLPEFRHILKTGKLVGQHRRVV